MNLSLTLIVLCVQFVLCSLHKPLIYVQNKDGFYEIFASFDKIKLKQLFMQDEMTMKSDLVAQQISNGNVLLTLVYNGRLPISHSHKLSLKECRMQREPKEIYIFEENLENTMFKGESSTGSIPAVFFLKEATAMSNFEHLKKECLNLKKRTRKRLKYERKYRRREALKSRKARSLSEILIMPGTKWCGSKRLASAYEDLSGYSSTDTCCRDHDLCPLSIPGFSKKYGLYNTFLAAVSHCACDARFRTCLKRDGSSASLFVGKVFFNIVKSRCFVFEKKKTCLKYGLWQCYKWGYRNTAVIKEQFPWAD